MRARGRGRSGKIRSRVQDVTRPGQIHFSRRAPTRPRKTKTLKSLHDFGEDLEKKQHLLQAQKHRGGPAGSEHDVGSSGFGLNPRKPEPHEQAERTELRWHDPHSETPPRTPPWRKGKKKPRPKTPPGPATPDVPEPESRLKPKTPDVPEPAARSKDSPRTVAKNLLFEQIAAGAETFEDVSLPARSVRAPSPLEIQQGSPAFKLRGDVPPEQRPTTVQPDSSPSQSPIPIKEPTPPPKDPTPPPKDRCILMSVVWEGGRNQSAKSCRAENVCDLDIILKVIQIGM